MWVVLRGVTYLARAIGDSKGGGYIRIGPRGVTYLARADFTSR